MTQPPLSVLHRRALAREVGSSIVLKRRVASSPTMRRVSRGNYAGRNWDQKYDPPPTCSFFLRFAKRPCAYMYVYQVRFATLMLSWHPLGAYRIRGSELMEIFSRKSLLNNDFLEKSAWYVFARLFSMENYDTMQTSARRYRRRKRDRDYRQNCIFRARISPAARVNTEITFDAMQRGKIKRNEANEKKINVDYKCWFINVDSREDRCKNRF